MSSLPLWLSRSRGTSLSGAQLISDSSILLSRPVTFSHTSPTKSNRVSPSLALFNFFEPLADLPQPPAHSGSPHSGFARSKTHASSATTGRTTSPNSSRTSRRRSRPLTGCSIGMSRWSFSSAGLLTSRKGQRVVRRKRRRSSNLTRDVCIFSPLSHPFRPLGVHLLSALDVVSPDSLPLDALFFLLPIIFHIVPLVSHSSPSTTVQTRAILSGLLTVSPTVPFAINIDAAFPCFHRPGLEEEVALFHRRDQGDLKS